MTRLFHWIATLGPVGQMHASGTVASFVTLPLVYWLKQFSSNSTTYLVVTGVVFWVSLYAASRAMAGLKRNDDPSEIVIDEVVGCLLAFWGIPFSAQTVIVGFILFRFFDISKLAGISHAERMHGPVGVMLDDILAALITNLILRAVV